VFGKPAVTGIAFTMRTRSHHDNAMAEDLQQDEAYAVTAPLGGQGAADVVVAQLPAVIPGCRMMLHMNISSACRFILIMQLAYHKQAQNIVQAAMAAAITWHNHNHDGTSRASIEASSSLIQAFAACIESQRTDKTDVHGLLHCQPQE
jgi:hypothetical protein